MSQEAGYGFNFGVSGSGFVLFTKTSDDLPAIFTGVDRTAAEIERNDYFNTPIGQNDLLKLDGNEFLLIQLIDESTDPDTVIYQNFRDPDFFDVSGIVTGPAGAASSLFFSSIVARDDFFSVTVNLELLETGLPIKVNTGGEVSTNFVWTGATSPISYDNTQWRVAASGASSGSLILGSDGARLSSGNQVMNFDTPGGETQVFIGVPYTTAGGSSPPFCFSFSSAFTFTIADIDTSNLSEPQDVQADGFGLTSLYVLSITIKPHEIGDLRVQAWIGTTDTDPKIIDVTQTIITGDVGNETIIVFPNPVLLRTPEQNLFRFSGVGLQGGLQTSGEFNGQTVPFMDIRGMLAVKVDIITNFIDFFTMREGPSQTATFKIVDASTVVDKYELTYSDATSDVTTTYSVDAVISAGTNDISYIQTTGNIIFTQNSVSFELSVVSTNPEGNLTKNQGSLALFIDGDTSGLFFKQTGIGNTGWVEVVHSSSGVIGPVSSTVTALAFWNNTTGSLLASAQKIFILEGPGGDNRLDIEAINGTGSATITLSNDGGSTGLLIQHEDTGDKSSIESSIGPLTILTSTDENINLTLGGSTSQLNIHNITSPDTNPLMQLLTGGADGATIDVHTGDQNPNTVVLGSPGALYIRGDGLDSTIYIHADNLTSNNNWINVFTFGTGDVTGPASSIINSIAIFDSTTGKSIDDFAAITVTASGDDRFFNIDAIDSAVAGLRLRDEADVSRFTTIYDDNNEEITLTSDTSGGLIYNTLQGDMRINITSASGGLRFSFLNSNDTNAVWTMATNGANGGIANNFIGVRNPEGNVSAAFGNHYWNSDGLNTGLYFKRSLGVSTTGWHAVLASPTVTTDNAIITSDGTGGNQVNALSTATLIATANNTTLQLNAVTNVGSSGVILGDSGGSEILGMRYIESTDLVRFNVNKNFIFDNIINSGTFTFNHGVSGKTTLATTGANTNAPFELSVTGANGGTSQFFLSSVNPNNVITGNPGDLCILVDAENSRLFQLQSAISGNTDWVSQGGGGGGDISGPGTSTNLSIPSWNGTDGDSLFNNSLALLTQSGSDTFQSLESGGAAGLSSYRLLNSSSVIKGNLSYNETTDTISLIGVGAPLLIQNTTTNGDIRILATGNSQIDLRTTGSNLNPPVTFEALGSGGTQIAFFTSTASPEGVITADPGDVCYVSSGLLSRTYQRQASSTGNTDWVSAGNLSGPASSTLNSLGVFDTTDGTSLLSNSNLTLTSTATDTTVHIRSPSVTGAASLFFDDSTGSNLGSLTYVESIDSLTWLSSSADFTINTDALTFIISASSADISLSPGFGRALVIFAGGSPVTDELLRISNTLATGGEEVRFFVSDASPQNVITADPGNISYRVDGANSKMYVYTDTIAGDDTWSFMPLIFENDFPILTLNSGSASGGGAFSIRNNANALRFTVQYDENTDDAILEAFAAGGLGIRNSLGALRLSSATAPIEIDRTQAANTGAVVNISNNTADTSVFVDTASPLGVTTGSPGDIQVEKNGTSSNIRLHIGSASNNTDWAQCLGGSPTFSWGDGGVQTTVITRYMSPGFDNGTATTSPIQFVIPRSGFLRNMHIICAAAAGNGNAIVYTVRLNSLTTGLFISLSSNILQGSNTSTTITVAAGDVIDIEVTKAATIGSSPSNIMCTMEFI